MGIGCGATVMKYILFVFNVFFFLCGATLLAIGIWGKVSDDNYLADIVTSSSDTLNATYIICIIVGIVLFLIGFLGCCGACMESAWMLALFAGLLMVITVVEIVGVVLAVIYRNELGDSAKNDMTKSAKEAVGPGIDDAVNKAWRGLQHEFKCCGSTGYADYLENAKYKVYQHKVPDTCCRLNNDDPQSPQVRNINVCNQEALGTLSTSTELYKRGCYKELKDWIEDHAYIFIGACVAIALIQICGILFACYVCRAIKNRE